MPLQSIVPAFAGLAELEASLASNWQPDDPPKRQGRPLKEERAATDLERQHLHRCRKRAARKRCIAILDMETDPFNAELKSDVKPFLCVLYSDEFEPIVIWEE